MTSGTAHAIWTELRDEFGDDVRLVAHYHGDIYDIRMREDVEDAYAVVDDGALIADEDESVDDHRAVVEELMYDTLSGVEQEKLFEAGEFGCVMRVFEDAYVIHCPFSAETGAIVSMDRGANLPAVTAIEDVLDAAQGDG